MAGFAGFETPDAIMAIAENSQTSSTWNKAVALAAVEATVTGGHDPLDVAEDLADAPNLTSGAAAKILVEVAAPLGLPLGSFDPQGDGPRNLVAALDTDAQPNGSYGTFNATLFVTLAKPVAAQAVPAATVAYVKAAQKSDGSWDYAGDPSGTGTDVDTTSLAIEALVAAGAGNSLEATKGLSYLAQHQSPSGAWASFGSDDPNSTSMAIMAITAAGFDPASSCWRNTVAPGLASNAYTSPIGWLNAQVAGDGHITSPNDGWGLNTYASSQSVQALRRSWMPPLASGARGC